MFNAAVTLVDVAAAALALAALAAADADWRVGYLVPPPIGDPRRYDPPLNLLDLPYYHWTAYLSLPCH